MFVIVHVRVCVWNDAFKQEHNTARNNNRAWALVGACRTPQRRHEGFCKGELTREIAAAQHQLYCRTLRLEKTFGTT